MCIPDTKSTESLKVPAFLLPFLQQNCSNWSLEQIFLTGDKEFGEDEAWQKRAARFKCCETVEKYLLALLMNVWREGANKQPYLHDKNGVHRNGTDGVVCNSSVGFVGSFKQPCFVSGGITALPKEASWQRCLPTATEHTLTLPLAERELEYRERERDHGNICGPIKLVARIQAVVVKIKRNKMKCL